jgi:hypothetical protein
MPPGWSHTGNHKTAKLIRREFFRKMETKPQGIVLQQQQEIVS